MKLFLIPGLLGMLAACNSNKNETRYQVRVNSLQLHFKKPDQRTNNWVMDSLQSGHSKEWYAVVELKQKDIEE